MKTSRKSKKKRIKKANWLKRLLKRARRKQLRAKGHRRHAALHRKHAA